MKKRKLFLGATLATAIFAQSMTAFAATATNDPDKDGSDAHTTIGIMEAKTNPGQASFEVPLYIVAAAVKNENDLVCPTGYDIKNTGAASIGVTKMSVEKLTTGASGWAMLANGTTPTAAKQMTFSIGDINLPALNDTTLKADVDIKNSKNMFYDNTASWGSGNTGKYLEIPAGKTLSESILTRAGKNIATASEQDLTSLKLVKTKVNGTDRAVESSLLLAGKVDGTKITADVKATPQFKVTYTVSALDENGQPIGNTYVGDNKAAAFPN